MYGPNKSIPQLPTLSGFPTKILYAFLISIMRDGRWPEGEVVLVIPLTEYYAMKAYWGSGGAAPPIP
jgi:hypothetical protein